MSRQEEINDYLYLCLHRSSAVVKLSQGRHVAGRHAFLPCTILESPNAPIPTQVLVANQRLGSAPSVLSKSRPFRSFRASLRNPHPWIQYRSERLNQKKTNAR